MNLALLSIVAFALAVLGVIRNVKADRPYGRKDFAIVFLIVSAPLLVITASDVQMLTGGEPLEAVDRWLQFTYIYLVVAAYPFFQRVCWRVNDAGSHRALSYVSLVPYINILIFLFLCFKPTKVSKG